MINRTLMMSAAIVAATMTGLVAQPAMAQYGEQQDQNQDRARQRDDRGRGPSDRFDEGYRTGYRAGYDAARNSQRYDDRSERFSGNRDDSNARWRQRYAQNYTYNDDTYYRECRSAPDPAGVIAGALIGGLLGNAVGRGNGGTTVAGVILGGVTGAALTHNLDCEDRSYAYKTYYDGFNSGRPNSSYRWRNPSNGHYGNFRVMNYANDPDGFRCASYSQEIFINRRPQTTRGRACQQPDGTWAIVG
jgi:surface antigen